MEGQDNEAAARTKTDRQDKEPGHHNKKPKVYQDKGQNHRGEDRNTDKTCTGQNKGTKDSTTSKGQHTGTKQNDRIEGIMFVPHTQGGKLARTIQESEDKFSRLHKTARVKVMERGGKKIVDILSKKDPWAPGKCDREGCMVCNSLRVEKKDKNKSATCSKESIVYKISCDTCANNNISAHYFGESARTTFLRGQEHLLAQEKGQEDSPLTKHDLLHHGGNRTTYSMRVERQHKSASV